MSLWFQYKGNCMDEQDVERRLRAAFGQEVGRVVRVVDVDWGESFSIHLARHDGRPPYPWLCDRTYLERMPDDASWEWLWEAVDAPSAWISPAAAPAAAPAPMLSKAP